MPTLNINGKDTAVDADESTPILWALRDTLGMTGTLFGECHCEPHGQTVTSVALQARVTGSKGLNVHTRRGVYIFA